MTVPLADFARLVNRLIPALRELEQQSRLLQLEPLAGREWFELLYRKLAPQLSDEAFLVVAVTGGTNIGKSVIFNHLAGFRASASSPLASGTKHPVCLVPRDFATRHDLAAVFPGFDLQPWTAAETALESSDAHQLFWREAAEVPDNLLVLDTPDIDSDAPVNWERAESIRQTADVLIAVLTQQKYNDAAVKQFFRTAAAADQAVVIVFNQVDISEDEPYWPLWLKTFTEETGVRPETVFLAPKNRQAAESITLGFFERGWPGETTDDLATRAQRLQDVFARFHFARIKLRTLRGSLAVVADDAQGVPGYLRELTVRSGEFRSAADLLSAQQLARIDTWPTPPSSHVVTAVRNWWAGQRQGWSATVHGVYDGLGQTILTPFRYVRTWVQGPDVDPWVTYRRSEWDAIVRIIGDVYTRLEWLTQLGHPLLKSRLDQLLQGASRAALIEQMRTDHSALDLAGTLGDVVVTQLQDFRQENPQMFQLFQRVDQAAAAARPVLTVVLGVTGVGLPFGEAATQLAAHGMTQAAMHVVGDVAGGTLAATVGETAISATASSGAGYLQAKFHQLQTSFTTRRAAWLADRLQQRLLGSLTAELQAAASIPRSPTFRSIQELLAEWTELLTRVPS